MERKQSLQTALKLVNAVAGRHDHRDSRPLPRWWRWTSLQQTSGAKPLAKQSYPLRWKSAQSGQLLAATLLLAEPEQLPGLLTKAHDTQRVRSNDQSPRFIISSFQQT
uniref:Uncharacterized protein n=1 Tax=Thermogemmatispora argillosa TaxID=2045280 RepID=A0A455T7M1_9CHLR|nr:hypothetical protein KTA_36430 [Thermogemmatispora argillosa]